LGTFSWPPDDVTPGYDVNRATAIFFAARRQKIRAFPLAATYRGAMEDAYDGVAETLTHALAALRAGRLESAERLSVKLLEAAPRDPAAHLLAANVALQRARYGDADRWARSCLALRADHPPAMLIAGRAARATGDFATAIDWFGRAGKFSPDRSEPFFQLCVAQLEGEDPAAQSTLELLLQRFPGDAEGWRQIGLALSKANQMEAAATAFARAAKASDDASHSFNLGAAMLALHRPEEAAIAFRKALARAPDLVEALLPLAQALRQSGAPREAHMHLLRCAEARPGNAQVFYTLGLICDDLRDTAGAIAAYRRCLELQPDLPEAHVNLGLALQQTGEMESAVQSYRKAIHLRADTFGRIAQALPSTRKGVLWLNLGKLRRSLGG
jgi:tetratricopeptide (TPR) repeat protein